MTETEYVQSLERRIQHLETVISPPNPPDMQYTNAPASCAPAPAPARARVHEGESAPTHVHEGASARVHEGEKVSVTRAPCCGIEFSIYETGPIQWNPYNLVVQCHACGVMYEPSTADSLRREYQKEVAKDNPDIIRNHFRTPGATQPMTICGEVITCGKCNKVMTPENAHMHPELFLCDECVKRYFLSASIPIQPEPNELGKARTEIDDLKHQFNCLEKEWSKRGADLEASRTQVRHWREESGKLHAKLKASRVPELEKALAFEKRSHEEAREECNKLERQRDEARSAATRAQMAESRLRNEMTAAFGAHGLAAGPEAINGLVREREELKKRNDTQKTLIENFQNTVEVLNKDKAAQANAIQQLQDKFGALVNERNRLIHEVSILEAKDTEMVSKHAELLKISDQIDLRTEALVTERDTALKDRDEKVRALVTERDRANRGREELVERNRELGRQASSAAVFIRDLENALADLLKTSPELRPAD